MRRKYVAVIDFSRPEHFTSFKDYLESETETRYIIASDLTEAEKIAQEQYGEDLVEVYQEV